MGKISISALLMVVFSCGGVSIEDDQDMPTPTESITITCPCDKYNATTDWTFCPPITVNFDSYANINRVEMYYSLRNTRGTSVIQAELLDLGSSTVIPVSQVESVVNYVTHMRKSENLATYLNRGEKQLAIRFRNTESTALSYVPNNSKLVIYFN